MIKRTMKLVITFHTTTDAMAMERMCRRAGAPGRLIPLPHSISAGCGLAWCADESCEAQLCALMQEAGIPFQQLHRCLV